MGDDDIRKEEKQDWMLSPLEYALRYKNHRKF